MQNYVENMQCSLSLFKTRKTLFAQICQKKKKNQNCQLKQKFGTERPI